MIKGTRTNTKLEMRLSKSRRRRLEAICLSSRSMLLLIFFVAWFILLGTSPQYTHVVMAALSPTSSGTGTRETETETTIRRGRRATTTATAKNANSLPRQNQKDRNDRRRKGEDKIKVLGGGGGLEGDNEREASKQGDKKFLVNKNKKMYNNQRLKKEEAVQIRQHRILQQLNLIPTCELPSISSLPSSSSSSTKQEQRQRSLSSKKHKNQQTDDDSPTIGDSDDDDRHPMPFLPPGVNFPGKGKSTPVPTSSPNAPNDISAPSANPPSITTNSPTKFVPPPSSSPTKHPTVLVTSPNPTASPPSQPTVSPPQSSPASTPVSNPTNVPPPIVEIPTMEPVVPVPTIPLPNPIVVEYVQDMLLDGLGLNSLPISSSSTSSTTTSSYITSEFQSSSSTSMYHTLGNKNQILTWIKSELQTNTNSYQYRAMLRVAQQENVTTTFSTALIIQYWILYCIYYSTNGNTDATTTDDDNGIDIDNFRSGGNRNSNHHDERDNIFSRTATTDVTEIVVPPETASSSSSSDKINVAKSSKRAATTSVWKRTDGWTEVNVPPCGSTSTDDTGEGWYGIRCDVVNDGNTDVRIVTEIRLSRNNLIGNFPFEIAFFASKDGDGDGGFYATVDSQKAGQLQVLDISHNRHLTAMTTIPMTTTTASSSSSVEARTTNENNGYSFAWISSLALGNQLLVLRYSHTSIDGPIPILSSLPNSLIEYDCSYTRHYGPIRLQHNNDDDNTDIDDDFDVDIKPLGHLTTLIMDGISIQSSIPNTMSMYVPNLKYFYIRNSNIIGTLSYISSFTSLIEHAVDSNQNLTGPLLFSSNDNTNDDDDIQLTNLKSFSATDCDLTGTIPLEWEQQVPNLVQVWLYGNERLIGTIPSYFAGTSTSTTSSFTNLQILALEGTNLGGTVPLELCLRPWDGIQRTLSVDCDDGTTGSTSTAVENKKVDCSAFFPDCCTCCGRIECGTFARTKRES